MEKIRTQFHDLSEEQIAMLTVLYVVKNSAPEMNQEVFDTMRDEILKEIQNREIWEKWCSEQNPAFYGM